MQVRYQAALRPEFTEQAFWKPLGCAFAVTNIKGTLLTRPGLLRGFVALSNEENNSSTIFFVLSSQPGCFWLLPGCFCSGL